MALETSAEICCAVTVKSACIVTTVEFNPSTTFAIPSTRLAMMETASTVCWTSVSSVVGSKASYSSIQRWPSQTYSTGMPPTICQEETVSLMACHEAKPSLTPCHVPLVIV